MFSRTLIPFRPRTETAGQFRCGDPRKSAKTPIAVVKTTTGCDHPQPVKGNVDGIAKSTRIGQVAKADKTTHGLPDCPLRHTFETVGISLLLTDSGGIPANRWI